MSGIRAADIEDLIDVVQYEEEGGFPVEQGYVWTSCASVENGNPLFWDEEVAGRVTGGPIAPPTMVSVWFRPHHWAPGRTRAGLPLQVHFDLKEGLGLPEAVMSDNTIAFYEPVRPGDTLRTRQILRSVSDEKTTKLGSGRFWVIDVEYHNQAGDLVAIESYTGFGYRRAGRPGEPSGTEGSRPSDGPIRAEPSRSAGPGGREGRGGSEGQGESEGQGGSVGRGGSVGAEGPDTFPRAGRLLHSRVAVGDRLPDLTYPVTATTVVLGALATRDWRPMHHDKAFAVDRNGTRDIFLNTPNQASWFERFVTDWTGPYGRLQRMTFRMIGSIFPGDTMVFRGEVMGIGVDEAGCGWVDLDIFLSVEGEPKTTCKARVALPVSDEDNPWERGGQRWRP